MDELVGLISSKVGISEDLARKAVEIILNFLNKSAPDDKMAQLLDAIPGSREAVESGGSGGGGLFGGAMGAMGAMGAVNEMTSAGLSMGQVQEVTKTTVRYAKEQAGEDTVNDIIASVPGLSQFI
jgi:hypothetical protein